MSAQHDVAVPSDRFDSTRVGLDLVVELPSLRIAVLSFQDPDDINLELVTAIG